MTKPPVPDNPITDFMNSDFTGAFDWSLLAMMLISTALVAVYVGAAMLIRGNNSPTFRSPKGMDLAFGLAIATPLAGFLVLGRSGLGSGLIIGGFALVIGLTLWGTARRHSKRNQPGTTMRIR
ncbi:hypothetical protein AB4Y88_00395 [Paenarthrobacter sp. RAF9]